MTQKFYRRNRVQAQQPNSGRLIDRSKPITAGLRFAAVGNSAWIDNAFYTATGAVYGANKFGQTVEKSSSDVIYGSTSYPERVSDVTFVVVGEIGTADFCWTFDSPYGFIGRDYGEFAILLRGTNTRYRVSYSGSVISGVVICTIKADGSSPRYFKDSKLIQSGAISTAPWGVDSATTYKGPNNESGSKNNLVAVFDRVISDKEIASLSENPWQIFRAQDSRIWLPAAGGGSYSVTSLFSPASALAYTASIDLQRAISALQTIASANGLTANINLQRSVASIFSPASASGYLSNVNLNRNITGALAQSAASGYLAGVNLNRSIAASIAQASAAGYLSNINLTRSIVSVLAQASAAGNTATVTLAGVMNIPASLANASAAGNSANVNLTYEFTTSPATASAVGYSASVNLAGVLNIVGSLAVATADGQSARIDRQYQIQAGIAQAIASASPATITVGSTGSFTPEQLAEILAYVEANMSVPTVEEIASAVLAALQGTTIPVNTTQIVGKPILGDGTTTEFYV